MMKLHPDLNTDPQTMQLYNKGIAGQWQPATVIDWNAPSGLDGIEARALGRLITPVYLGEQVAMSGVATVLPQYLQEGEAPEELYLSTMGLDEARHFEALNRLYRTMKVDPIPMHRFPEMFQFHHRLLEVQDKSEWLYGILICDILAKQFYGWIAKSLDGHPAGDLAAHILVDEGRHQAFSVHTLGKAIEKKGDELTPRMLAMRDDLLDMMKKMYVRMKDDVETLGIDPDAFFGTIEDDLERKNKRIGIVKAA
ncbi:MAG: ferritin-like domain-containing protein [Firmicutes bacterium]|nr:ferritin-like domain-containing protein [Bacillota bacterium]